MVLIVLSLFFNPELTPQDMNRLELLTMQLGSAAYKDRVRADKELYEFIDAKGYNVFNLIKSTNPEVSYRVKLLKQKYIREVWPGQYPQIAHYDEDTRNLYIDKGMTYMGTSYQKWDDYTMKEGHSYYNNTYLRAATKLYVQDLLDQNFSRQYIREHLMWMEGNDAKK